MESGGKLSAVEQPFARRTVPRSVVREDETSPSRHLRAWGATPEALPDRGVEVDQLAQLIRSRRPATGRLLNLFGDTLYDSGAGDDLLQSPGQSHRSRVVVGEVQRQRASRTSWRLSRVPSWCEAVRQPLRPLKKVDGQNLHKDQTVAAAAEFQDASSPECRACGSPRKTSLTESGDASITNRP